jgi:hypothetical protein
VEFEPTIPASERAGTVHAFDREATVIGNPYSFHLKSTTAYIKTSIFLKDFYIGNFKSYLAVNTLTDSHELQQSLRK